MISGFCLSVSQAFLSFVLWLALTFLKGILDSYILKLSKKSSRSLFIVGSGCHSEGSLNLCLFGHLLAGDTIRKIENIVLPKDIILASFDVVLMFTWVPQDEVFRVTLEILANLDPWSYDPMMPDKEYMAELLRFLLCRNSFELNGEHFLQIWGVPMGQKASGSICNIVVHELENKIPQSTDYIHTLHRFMDDTLVFWKGSMEQLETFIRHINTLRKTLKFTYEASNHSIQFLDLVIYIKGNVSKKQAS